MVDAVIIKLGGILFWITLYIYSHQMTLCHISVTSLYAKEIRCSQIM